jgi:hypothetical protein
VWARFAWLPGFPLLERDWTERDRARDTAAVISRRHGKGRTVYLAWDIGGGFYGAAKRRTRLLMRNLLSDAPAQPYHIEGPPWLVATAWRQAGNRLVFHLLQGQGTPARFPQWWGHITLEDVPPVDNIRIVLPDRDVSRCWMPLPNAELPLATAGDGVAVTVPRVVRHEIVVFEVEPHENAFSQPHRRGSC